VEVSVQLHTILGRETPDGILRKLKVELPDNSSVEDLVQQLGIELRLESLLLVVNGRMVEGHTLLQPGDRVSLMPAISGG
jgi:sulfur carrier protein ThiS